MNSLQSKPDSGKAVGLRENEAVPLKTDLGLGQSDLQLACSKQGILRRYQHSQKKTFYLFERVEVWIPACLCGFFIHDASKSAPNPERDMGPTQKEIIAFYLTADNPLERTMDHMDKNYGFKPRYSIHFLRANPLNNSGI